MDSSFPAPLGVLTAAKTWEWSWNALGRAAPPGLQKQLLEAWSEPQRHYHALRHLRECLALWSAWRDQCAHPGEVAIALWFHDAVYEPRELGNEHKSASWAADSLSAAGVDGETVQRVYDLVMDTCHMAPPYSGSHVEAVRGVDSDMLLDMDLAILGSPTARFETYSADVRREYPWVPTEQYRRERAAVLQGFLDRPRIFRSPPGFQAFETRARANLSSALRALRA
jgi:predicted metal-dependent HD superfamily phosphohydrolase